MANIRVGTISVPQEAADAMLATYGEGSEAADAAGIRAILIRHIRQTYVDTEENKARVGGRPDFTVAAAADLREAQD
jgi:hypothetical protein